MNNEKIMPKETSTHRWQKTWPHIAAVVSVGGVRLHNMHRKIGVGATIVPCEVLASRDERLPALPVRVDIIILEDKGDGIVTIAHQIMPRRRPQTALRRNWTERTSLTTGGKYSSCPVTRRRAWRSIRPPWGRTFY